MGHLFPREAQREELVPGANLKPWKGKITEESLAPFIGRNDLLKASEP